MHFDSGCLAGQIILLVILFNPGQNLGPHLKIINCIIGFVLLSVYLAGLPARATENEFQQWSILSLGYRINDLYSVGFLTQGRFAISDDRADIYVFRPSLNRKLSDRLTVGAGIDYLKQDPGNPERRIWQEIVARSVFHSIMLKHRFRLEERFIDDIKPIYRGRYNLKGTYPLAESRWSIVGSNEIFFNFNSRGRGPAPGFDQNRLFAGLGYDFSDNTRVEAGYLWRYQSRRDIYNIHDHAIAIYMNFNL